MLLNSLKIKDFRQFKGEQTIVFAADPQKNVTVIMGDNGTGKTTLAQAFTWCLYGETDFADKILLCKATSRDMMPGDSQKVRAELALTHKGVEYTIVSEQLYIKDSYGIIKTRGQRKFTIMYKQGGQIEYVKESQLDGRMKEILPFELARYFFFDGERINVMSKRLSQGKGDEFARAVRSLLGLDAFLAAIEHLKKTIKEYDKQYDVHSDSKIAEYNEKIQLLDTEIERIDERLADIDHEETPVTEKIEELLIQIEKNRASSGLAEKKKKLIARRESLVATKARNVGELLSAFKRAPSYFAMKLMRDCLVLLKDEHKMDKSVPNINDKTIKHLIERGRCICGSEVCTGNKTFIELTKLLEYVPPKNIGDSISGFRGKCQEKVRNAETMFTDFEAKYANVCAFDSDYDEVLQDIYDIEQQLLGMADVGKLQSDLMRYETHLRKLRDERVSISGDKRVKETDRDRAGTERDKLTLKDENNRRVMRYKAYAQYMHDSLCGQYATEEKRIREELEKTVNEIFQSILGDGFSLALTEKYDVLVTVNEYGGSAETSTAQNISIIFAFIAGVIQMARASQEREGGLLVSEPYPLVMDAPLSAFDKTRIQTVCDVLPKIAEQVIIFIKDADGEIAEEHLGSRIGKRLTFHAANDSKIETYIS
jgi:DNA sulfur modification protein DndD